MDIEFTDTQLKTIASHTGFAITNYYMVEDELRLFGEKKGQFVEASLFINFKTKTTEMTLYYSGNDYLEKEEKFTLDF